MLVIEPVGFTFVIRIWLEPREIEGAKPIWRGIVEHLQSGEHQYFENLDEIPVIFSYFLAKNIDKSK